MDSKKTALVTGSSSGIGFGIAKVLLEKGYQVVLHGIETQSQIDKEIKTLEKLGKVIGYYQVDMGNTKAIEQFCKELKDSKINVDILVNNAGIQHVSPIQDFLPEKWDQIIAINLSSAFHLTRHLLPHMQKQKWGRIINIASAHGLVASANKSAYVASKHAIVGLTKVAALENAKIGITCNAVCPGWVLTPLVESQIQKKSIEQNISIEQATENLLAEKQPSNQFVTPEDVGQFVLFLCSKAANQINGTALSIDGGWVAQ
ncbi:MAG: 3-hydroxybutyrate dehydrogenase [Proteobacteria bacterium]|nr:3-hydroxybutyrate dehydrogenase [Pseudomonadota bacterium]